MPKFDINQEITNRFIAALESGVIPWKKPWDNTVSESVSSRAFAVDYRKGKPYNLINQMLLGFHGEYATFKFINECGGRIKKGSKASHVLQFFPHINYFNSDGKRVISTEGMSPEEIANLTQKLTFSSTYQSVFSIADCEGIELKHENVSHVVNVPDSRRERDDLAEAVIKSYCDRANLDFKNQPQNTAFYSPAGHYVRVPLRSQFEHVAEYYSTLFHELAHSTGHSTLLNRDYGHHFGEPKYAYEELVAEISASAILYHLHIEQPSSFKNSSAYIQSWLGALKNDKNLIITAAQKADKAVELILGCNRESEIVSKPEITPEDLIVFAV